MDRPADLPDFASPPLDEVVIGVLFDVIDGLTETMQLRFWQELQSEYPNLSLQQRLVTFQDDLEEPATPSAQQDVRVFQTAPARLWLESTDTSYLVQVQNNLLFSNWRLRGEPYPRYESLVARFERVYAQFLAFLATQGLRAPRVTALELDYMNWIRLPDMQDAVRCAAETKTSGRGIDEWPEAQSHLLKYRMRDDDGKSIGVLRVECQSAARAEGDRWIDGTSMNITARVLPTQAEEFARLAERFDKARIAIVQAFADHTTQEAQARWR